MKLNFLKTKIILLLFLLSTTIVNGQSKLHIHESDGSAQSFQLSTIKKLTFSGESTLMVHQQGSTTSFAIEDINYMTFSSPVSISESQIGDFNVYPNPVSHNVTVKNGKMIDELKIFDMQGKLCLHLSPKQEIVNIDISSFPVGIYFLQIISNNKVSTSKIVKTSNN